MRCPGYSRHWFAPYGSPGVRAPHCVRCKAPNPRPLDRDELETWEYGKQQGWW